MADWNAESFKYAKLSEPNPGVILVELQRKPVNAFTEDFWREYQRVFEGLNASGSVRVVVLSSALPKIFTAGIDLSVNSLSNVPTADDPARLAFLWKDHIQAFQYAIGAPERCRYPVIVAVHGAVFGLGIDIITACDIRYAAANATFSIKEVDVGLAADIGTLARLPKVTGNESLLRELALSAQTFDTAMAQALGLVSRVIDGSRDEVLTAALELARAIASKSPVAVVGTKQVLLHARDHSVQDNLDFTSVWNSAMLQTSDVPQAAKATLSKSTTAFMPLPSANSKL